MLQFFQADPRVGVAFAAMVILAISLHEMAHAWMALKCGDATAARLGRLTLNPAAHFDPVGLGMILLVGFGWGKPVPVDFRFLRNLRRDTMYIAAAGPISNVMQAGALALLFRIIFHTPLSDAILQLPGGEAILKSCLLVFAAGVHFNFLLAFFNLIPLFPLDGDKILAGLLPYRQAQAFDSIRQYSPMILTAILLAEFLLHLPILSTFLGLTAAPLGHLFLGVPPLNIIYLFLNGNL